MFKWQIDRHGANALILPMGQGASKQILFKTPKVGHLFPSQPEVRRKGWREKKISSEYLHVWNSPAGIGCFVQEEWKQRWNISIESNLYVHAYYLDTFKVNVRIYADWLALGGCLRLLFF